MRVAVDFEHLPTTLYRSSRRRHSEVGVCQRPIVERMLSRICRYLEAEKHFTTIDVYEQRSTAGGVWNYTPENDADATFAIPSTTPDVGLEQPVWRESTETNPRAVQEKKKATFISPL